MPINRAPAALATVRRPFTVAVIGGLLAWLLPVSNGAGQEPSTQRPTDTRLTPYSSESDHLWNRLHEALFARTGSNEKQFAHFTDPLLYRSGTTILLEGDAHRKAVTLLDQFLATPDDPQINEPLKRLFLHRDLWAAFDYTAWYPDDWVHHTRHEPAAIALRTRLAMAIARLALSDREFDELPDNLTLAVQGKQFPAVHDPDNPERPFLPSDLFDPAGPWVWFHESGTAEPITPKHFDGAGGRAVHIVFLNLPGGRATTEEYLKKLGGDTVKQFPPGTKVAMVRRALAVDRSAKLRITPVTELVQMRVYRRIPDNPRANFEGDFGVQDMYEFVLDRVKFFQGEHGLVPTAGNMPLEPFERTTSRIQSHRCIDCHQAPGVSSVLSMRRGMKRVGNAEHFSTHAFDVEMKYTVRAKIKQFNWGLLQGLLEAKRESSAEEVPGQKKIE